MYMTLADFCQVMLMLIGARGVSLDPVDVLEQKKMTAPSPKERGHLLDLNSEG